MLGLAAEGVGFGGFSVAVRSWSARRRKRVSREPERERFFCAKRRCRTSVDKLA
jgi:hypothetical protein